MKSNILNLLQNKLLQKWKISPPVLLQDYIKRQRLTKIISRGNKTSPHCTFLLAPPGYGKTSLMSEWLHLEKKIHNIWISLEKQDNDTKRFLENLILSIKMKYKNIGVDYFKVLEDPVSVEIDYINKYFSREIAGLETPVYIILDNYHVIDNQNIHQIMQQLLNHLPGNLHLFLLSRSEPPLFLSKLRTQGQVTVINQSDLAFTSSEVKALLRKKTGLLLNELQIETIFRKTEGWIAALLLCILSLQSSRNRDVDEFVNDFDGSDHYIMDYLFEEVFCNLDRETSDFLRKTALLERVNSDLCNQLTGVEGTEKSLHQLEKANLLIAPMDNRRKWYKYHQLLIDYMHSIVEIKEQRKSFIKAARWFEEKGSVAESIELWLKAAEYEKVRFLIKKHIPELLYTVRSTIILKWLGMLPAEHLDEDHGLLIIQAICFKILKMHVELGQIKPKIERLIVRDFNSSDLSKLEEVVRILNLKSLKEPINPALISDLVWFWEKEGGFKKPITPREIEILELISEGYSNREIGEKLFISTGTVKWHINHILEKLHVNNRIQAANKAKESNLL